MYTPRTTAFGFGAKMTMSKGKGARAREVEREIGNDRESAHTDR